ncbi:DISARM system SNF2-like helicase DrmD [Kytococcus sedentarius]|uniref:DISARM system SNF2-like helicase DrmD n=1 Tax=Kytococcus sedentarius TaxID=1276 RepID=UPI00194DEE01|nr:DISARM system SNF2-like helicase DrmD [Kytococcus sedentarius]QRO87013.1 DEAD/DEAH box helicase [Kytococcus sedentarius]
MTAVPASDAARRMPQIPEAGQVVSVRGSTWAVTEVRRQGLERSSADEGRAALDTVVSLSSLDEDRLGEELTVIWGLEVGHAVNPDQGLPESISPDGFDNPHRLAAFVDAVRWGAVTSADEKSFQSPFRSGADVKAYQLEPLRRALQAPRTNLLLADDVGLGKTIEAGLVIQELLLRHRARSVVIVCPPSLSLKWQDEMREKFGLDFEIVDSDCLSRVRRTHGLAANPFHIFPRVIVSMAWLSTPRAQRYLRDVYARAGAQQSARRFAFDLLVVDEAHHVAPSSPSAPGKGYAIDSQRTRATRELAAQCEHRLFLSATPHNGHSESFTALLEMIDNRRFARGARVDEKALREVAVRRLKTEITDGGFKPRKIADIPFTPSDDEQRAFERLERILKESARQNGNSKGGDIVSMLLKKRFLSSPYAFLRTLDRYLEAADAADWEVEDGYYAEVLGSGQSDEEEGAVEHPEFTALRRSRSSDPLVAASSEDLDELLDWAARYEHRPDARLQALLEYLDAVCRPGGEWGNERVVVFTEYADTLTWLRDVLEGRGYKDRLEVIQGSTPTDQREQIRARFTASPTKHPVRVLLATDSAGEGIDLQNYCHRLVNYDIPFNPSRLEQRIGRIDRYGQRHTPEVFHFSPSEKASSYAADMDFLRRIAKKVGQIAADLGSVNQVVDAQIQRHFARGAGSVDAVSPTEDAVRKVLAGGEGLNRQLTRLADTYDESKEAMHLTPANARRVVDEALRLSNHAPLVEVGSDLTDAPVFTFPAGMDTSWATAMQALTTRLEQDVRRPVTFDGEADRGDDEIVHVHLGHPVMQKASRLLRAGLFSAESEIRRVTALVVDDLEESCVAAVARLVLVGRGGVRLHEEVFLTGIRLRGNAMAEAKVEAALSAALDARAVQDPDHPGRVEELELAPEGVREWISQEWASPSNTWRRRLDTAVRQRAERREEEVAQRLAERQAAEEERARQIFAGFRTTLQESLAEARSEEAKQAQMLFGDDEQQQRRTDIRAMEDRLSTLEQEETRELAALAERYADVDHHVASAAVIFALTPQDAAAHSGEGEKA